MPYFLDTAVIKYGEGFSTVDHYLPAPSGSQHKPGAAFLWVMITPTSGYSGTFASRHPNYGWECSAYSTPTSTAGAFFCIAPFDNTGKFIRCRYYNGMFVYFLNFGGLFDYEVKWLSSVAQFTLPTSGFEIASFDRADVSNGVMDMAATGIFASSASRLGKKFYANLDTLTGGDNGAALQLFSVGQARELMTKGSSTLYVYGYFYHDILPMDGPHKYDGLETAVADQVVEMDVGERYWYLFNLLEEKKIQPKDYNWFNTYYPTRPVCGHFPVRGGTDNKVVLTVTSTNSQLPYYSCFSAKIPFCTRYKEYGLYEPADMELNPEPRMSVVRLGSVDFQFTMKLDVPSYTFTDITKLKFYFSGGVSNSNPAASLGGVKSVHEVPGTLHGLLPAMSAVLSGFSGVEHRCIYVQNTSVTETAEGVVLWVSVEPGHGNVNVGLDPVGKNGTAQTIGGTGVVPTGVSFENPLAEELAISIGRLQPTEYVAIWVQRVAEYRPEFGRAQPQRVVLNVGVIGT